MLASILLLSLTLMLTSAPAWAVATVTATSTCKSVSGQTFSVAGSVKITVNFPDYATARLHFLNWRMSWELPGRLLCLAQMGS